MSRRDDSFFVVPLYATERRNAAANSWSIADIRRLRELAQEGVSLSLIAATLRRSESAIRNKATLHGISLHGQPQGGRSLLTGCVQEADQGLNDRERRAVSVWKRRADRR